MELSRVTGASAPTYTAQTEEGKRSTQPLPAESFEAKVTQKTEESSSLSQPTTKTAEQRREYTREKEEYTRQVTSGIPDPVIEHAKDHLDLQEKRQEFWDSKHGKTQVAEEQRQFVANKIKTLEQEVERADRAKLFEDGFFKAQDEQVNLDRQVAETYEDKARQERVVQTKDQDTDLREKIADNLQTRGSESGDSAPPPLRVTSRLNADQFSILLKQKLDSTEFFTDQSTISQAELKTKQEMEDPKEVERLLDDLAALEEQRSQKLLDAQVQKVERSGNRPVGVKVDFEI